MKFNNILTEKKTKESVFEMELDESTRLHVYIWFIQKQEADSNEWENKLLAIRLNFCNRETKDTFVILSKEVSIWAKLAYLESYASKTYLKF